MLDFVMDDSLFNPQVIGYCCAHDVNVHSCGRMELDAAISRRNAGISKSGAFAVLEAADDIVLERLPEDGMVGIKGRNIRIAGGDPSIDAEFINANSPVAVYRVPLQDMAVNSPSKLIFTAPAMPSVGTVFFRITPRFSRGGRILKTCHSATFAKRLAVAVSE
jgi:hypothetical protein